MAYFITKPEDITNPRARAIFMAFTNAFHNGDVQAAIAEHNQNALYLEEIEKSQDIERQSAKDYEINLRFTKG